MHNALGILLLAYSALQTSAGSIAQYALGDNQNVDRNRQGAVASENRVCSQIGINLLKAGGNAADAVSSGNLKSFAADSNSSMQARRHGALHWRRRRVSYSTTTGIEELTNLRLSP